MGGEKMRQKWGVRFRGLNVLKLLIKNRQGGKSETGFKRD